MTHKIVKASSHDITNIKILQNNQLAQAERDAILQWLSPIDFHATQASILERRHEGTSGWIIALSEFQDYCQGTGQRLWCHGIPGAGKTVIAAILFDYLKTTYGEDETQNIRVTGIYCNYKEADIQSPVNLLASIYFQLVSEDSALPIELERLYSNGKNRLKRMRPTFLEIKSLLAAKISGYSRIFLIVDALDELPENSRRILITTVQTVRPDINLLVTSRYLDNIALDLKDWVKLEIKASRGDIEAYVKHRLSEGNRLEKLVNRDIALKKVVVVTVVEKSLHMFLLAQLHMDSLATKLTPGEISEALSDLPAELYDTYDNALRRIEDQGPSASKLANRILMWISYAGRPLRVTEMQHALAIRPDTEVLDLSFMPEEDDLTSLCAGLVLIDHKRTLRLVHYSMQEYFESIRDTRFPSAQVIITRACLAYISHDIFNACLLQSGAEIESRLRQYPFARYASPYWLTHARASPEEHLIDAILHFVKNPYPVGNYLTIKLRHGPRKALILAPWKEFLIYGHQEQWNTWSKIAFAEGHNLIETATHLSNKVLHNSSIDDVDYGSALIRGICVRVLES
ncbi:hypothetical protein BGZ60DRAFT_390514 [Tricladium varicosporioides]|nr:hypothetical protein BGZ60DRAFT_390514 [Hymenoscyphus varicosporioides]